MSAAQTDVRAVEEAMGARYPVAQHRLFSTYVAEVMQPVPEQTLLVCLEEIICNQTGATLRVLQAVGRVAAEIVTNQRATA